MDWGIPNWLVIEEYGDTANWPDDRWRWEFTRRRADFREDFVSGIEDTLELNRQVRELALLRGSKWAEDRWLRPDEPGFFCTTTIQQHEKYGTSLFNPSISEQCQWRFLFTNLKGNVMVVGGGEMFEDHPNVSVPDGMLAYLFNLDEPIPAQINDVKKILTEYQIDRHGKKIQRKKNRGVWLRYLRVLDGRESGASWLDIFNALLADDKAHNKNPAQEARSVWESANYLRYNFKD